MIRLICKKLQQRKSKASTRAHGHFFSTSSLKPTSDCSNSTDPQSLNVSYLVKSCGLSLESAIRASKKLQIRTTDQLDSVLSLLRSNGLTQSQVKNLITKRPLILLADPNKTLKPNMDVFGSLGILGTNLVKVLNKYPRILESDARATVEFFRAYGFAVKQIFSLTMKCPSLYSYNAPKICKPKLDYLKSLGFPNAEITQMLSYSPSILTRSLENQLIPSVQVIRRIVGTDDNVLKVIKARYRFLELNLEKVLETNVAILINRGVPMSLVYKLIMLQPGSLILGTHRFTEVVEEVEKLGFDPKNLRYVLAIHSMGVIGKPLWKQKVRAYGSFGMSEDQTLSAFKLKPMCMLVSEKKIRKLMGFFVNELKLKPSMVSKNSSLMLASLEKRIIPRCSVLQLLMSKGMIKEDISLVHSFSMTHKTFVRMYVSKYQNVIPEVVEAHEGKIQFQGFPIELKA